MDYTALIIIGLLTGLNAFYAIITHLDKKRIDKKENLFIKAIIANNVAEYAGAEDTPADRVALIDKENELAINARRLENEQGQREAPELRIPIGT